MQQKPLRTVERARLANVAHRFAKISQDDPVKLFSLLYMLDVRHFRESGCSCTGESYYAMADGPAPGMLRPLLVMRDLEMDVAIGILTDTDARGPWTFHPPQFCRRGLEIMTELETAHTATGSRDLPLDDGNAWWRVYTKFRGVGALIPYELTLGSEVTRPEHLARSRSFARQFRVRDPELPCHRDVFNPASASD